jgi:hypothetical protein
MRLGELRSASPNDFAKSLAIAAPSACQIQVVTWEEVAQVRTFNFCPGETYQS